MLLRTTLLLLLISAIPASVSAECINSFLSCIGGVNSGFSSADATGELNCSMKGLSSARMPLCPWSKACQVSSASGARGVVDATAVTTEELIRQALRAAAN